MADLLEYTPEQRATRILRKYVVEVTEHIKGCLPEFNNRLLAEAMVAPGVYDPDVKGVGPLTAASALYQACITTVAHDPSKFPTLLAILSHYSILDKVVKNMKSDGIAARLIPDSGIKPRGSLHGSTQPTQRDLKPQDSDESILTVREMPAVLNELRDFSEWRKLGRNLGISEDKLGVINKDHQDVGERLEEVIKYWLRRNHNEEEYEPPTRHSLAKAVEPIDNALARNIRGKHGIRSTSVPVENSPNDTATQPRKGPANSTGLGDPGQQKSQADPPNPVHLEQTDRPTQEQGMNAPVDPAPSGSLKTEAQLRHRQVQPQREPFPPPSPSNQVVRNTEQNWTGTSVSLAILGVVTLVTIATAFGAWLASRPSP